MPRVTTIVIGRWIWGLYVFLRIFVCCLPRFMFVVLGRGEVACSIVHDNLLPFANLFCRSYVYFALHQLVHITSIRAGLVCTAVCKAHQPSVAGRVHHFLGGRDGNAVRIQVVFGVLAVPFVVFLSGENIACVLANNLVLLEISGGEEPLARVWDLALFDCKPQRFGAVGVARVHPYTDLVPATRALGRGGCATDTFQLARHPEPRLRVCRGELHLFDFVLFSVTSLFIFDLQRLHLADHIDTKKRR